jgi:hypothetical protein
MAKLLHKYKNLQFEIQGHVCCTPPYQKEAIDKDTKKKTNYLPTEPNRFINI